MQILSRKSDCDKYLNKNTGSVSPIDRSQSTGTVLDGNGLVTKWYRSGIEKESGKIQAEGRRKTRER